MSLEVKNSLSGDHVDRDESSDTQALSGMLQQSESHFDSESLMSSEEDDSQVSNLEQDSQDIKSNEHEPEHEHDHESDTQDQRPTEATDDSDETSHTPIVIPLTIDDSLNSVELFPENISESLPPVQESEVVANDISSLQLAEANDSGEQLTRNRTLSCSLSVCIPCTGPSEIISITSDIEVLDTKDFAGVEKPKDKNNIGHIMISYNHSTRPLCMKIAKDLKNLKYKVWIDQDNISGDIFTSMASAVENAFVVLMAINEEYFNSRYCRLEAEYSVEKNKAYIPMMMQADYRTTGWLGIIHGSTLHIDFTKFSFPEAFNLLVREIEVVRLRLISNCSDCTTSVSINSMMSTTMSSAPTVHYRDVHDWNEDDVMDWVRSQRLEAFRNSLRNFTGSTLWQLYKIRLDSPTDYYRMIDTLLPPNDPTHLFQTLTFKGALENLFTKPHHITNR